MSRARDIPQEIPRDIPREIPPDISRWPDYPGEPRTRNAAPLTPLSAGLLPVFS